jgi:hypothetical protein
MIFSWTAEHREFGSVVEGREDSLPHIDFDGGEVIEIRSDSVICDECQQTWSMTELQEHVESDDQDTL